MIDVANHIVARNRWGIPAKSADSFRILRDHNYLQSRMKNFLP